MTLWGTIMRMISTPTVPFIIPFGMVCILHFLQCMITFAGGVNSDHRDTNTTSTNNLVANDAVIYSYAKGDDIVCASGHSSLVEHQLLNFMLSVIIQPPVHYPVKIVVGSNCLIMKRMKM